MSENTWYNTSNYTIDTTLSTSTTTGAITISSFPGASAQPTTVDGFFGTVFTTTVSNEEINTKIEATNERLSNIEDRLRVINPDKLLHKKFKELEEMYDAYKVLEKQCRTLDILGEE